MVRIAMLGQKRIPSREGGVEVVVEELSVRMAAAGLSVTCFNRREKTVSDRSAEKPGEYREVKIRTVPTWDRKGLAAVTSSFFASVCAGLGSFDVVHIHSEGPAFFCFIPKLFGKKVIVTVHGLDWQRAKWGKFASRYIRAGEKSAVRFADSIIVLSHKDKQYFSEKYHRETEYIPNGVTRPDKKELREIRKWGLEKDSYVLFLGRLVPEKGVHYLIEAWKSVPSDKKLVIAGGSRDAGGYYEELVQSAAGDGRILFTGHVQGRELEELYSNAYVFCLPSDLEGMPMALLEAMSFGNCCLISDIPECTEAAGDGALTFRRADQEDLREKLKFLLASESTVREFRAKAADAVCRKYRWEDVVERTLRIYG